MNASRTTITQAEPLDGRWIRLTFGDGAVHEVDLADLLQAGGVSRRSATTANSSSPSA